MSIRVHQGDLPNLNGYGDVIAVDTETRGLLPHRDRLCVVQLSSGDGSADLVQIAKGQKDAPNLKALLGDPSRLKLYHYGRFDIAILRHCLTIDATPAFCTKIASRLVRTYTDRHGLKDLTRELIGVELSKQQQSSDWAVETLSDAQLSYAASDVLYLHRLYDILKSMLMREDRLDVAQECFDFLPIRVRLDLMGWPDIDIFAHA